MKDFQYVQRHFKVAAHDNLSVVIESDQCVYMDKKSVLISGDLASVGVYVRVGDSQLNLKDFPNTFYFSPGAGKGYINIPFACVAVEIKVTNPGADTNVSFYGGSA